MAKHGPETEDDFLRMQQEAIMRVREMQSRARATLENAGMHIDGGNTNAQARETIKEPAPVTQTQRTAETRHSETTGQTAPIPKPHSTRPQSNMPISIPAELSAFNLSLDSEQIMLMLTLYLLVKDGADQFLILSLAYILMS